MNNIDIHLLEGFFMLLYIFSLYGYYLWFKSNDKIGYRMRFYRSKRKRSK